MRTYLHTSSVRSLLVSQLPGDNLNQDHLIEVIKEIGHKEPYFNTKIFIFSFTYTYTNHAQYNEGCSKLNYLLAEV